MLSMASRFASRTSRRTFDSVRAASRAAWQVAFQAEAAALRSEHDAQAVLGLAQVFEQGLHNRFVQAARKHGYNSTVRRHTVAA